MAFFVYCLAIALFACRGLTSVSDTLESPFGLTFTPTTLIASRYNASGSIELRRLHLGLEYRSLYVDAVHQFDSTAGKNRAIDADRVPSTFGTATRPMTESLRSALGHMPEYAAFFFPSVFTFATRNAAVTAIVGNYGEQPLKHGNTVQASWRSYGFLDGENLGRAPQECNEEGPSNYIIVLEYEKDYLQVSFHEVAFHLRTCYTIQEKFCQTCGERAHEIGAEAYRTRVNNFLTSFVDQILQKQDRESIRAIVLSGESPTKWVTELGQMVQSAIGSETAKVMTVIDPSDVAAYGAAVWARLVQKQPHRFTLDGGSKLSYEEYHDEL